MPCSSSCVICSCDCDSTHSYLGYILCKECYTKQISHYLKSFSYQQPKSKVHQTISEPSLQAPETRKGTVAGCVSCPLL